MRRSTGASPSRGRSPARFARRVILIGVAAAGLLVGQARAQDDPQMLRDAEIETDLIAFEAPVYRAAGLDIAALHIYLVNDMALNSFVAGGQNIFMNVGTIMRAERPNQLIGIMAHETGHIAGGHIARSEDAMRKATYEGLAAMVLGAAMAAVSGGAAGAALLGASGVAQNAWLQYSIEQEARADQAALTFLDRTHQSAQGLLDFFLILQQQEFLTGQQEIPYLRTHPLTEQRVDYMREHVERSPYSKNTDPPDQVAMLKRMKAKLDGFLQPPEQTLNEFPDSDQSLTARYARAIAYYRIPDLGRAVPAIDSLIHDYPNDPYFAELKGQMLFENGRIAEAVAPYARSSKLDPGSMLLRTELAQVQIESGDPKLLNSARANLEEVVRNEVQNPEAWRLLAIAYGRAGNMGMAALALAEQGSSKGDVQMARGEALHALKLLPGGTARQRAQDIADEAKRNLDK
ncbi:MAG TPA: M48 family metalloprotease [Stellaceae bacterium]